MVQSLSRWVWLVLVPLASCSPAPEAAPAWHFLLDREACSPPIASLEGTPNRLDPSDVTGLEGFFFRIGEPGIRRLRSVRDVERITMLIDTEDESVIACDAETFPAIGPEKRARLAGVRLDTWNERVERSLGDLDFERVVITVTDGAAIGDRNALPPLPRTLRALVIESRTAAGFGDLESLRELTELRFLWLAAVGESSLRIDLTLFGEARQLQSLYCWGPHLTGAKSLTAFRELRALDLQWGELDTKSLSFVDALPELRVLRLPRLDLERFAMEKPARNLVTLDLSCNTDLSGFRGELFPNLEFLALGGTSVSPGAIKAYQRGHRRCRISFAPE